MNNFSNRSLLIGVQVESLEGKKVLTDILEQIREYFSLTSISSVFRVAESAEGRGGNKDKLVLVLKSESEQLSLDVCDKVRLIEGIIRQRFPLRTIDLFLLCHEDEVAMNPKLVLPHPLLTQSEGMLAGASELWPKYRHPALGKTLEEIILKADILAAEFVFQGKSLLTQDQKLSLYKE